MITIRRATPDDAEAISRLNCEQMGYGFPVEATRQKLEVLCKSQHVLLLVAVVLETVIGCVHANDYELVYAPPMKNIMGLAVDKAYRRQGIGRRLLQAVESWARETGAAGVRLVSGRERTQAHAFYESCGYLNQKLQRNYKKLF